MSVIPLVFGREETGIRELAAVGTGFEVEIECVGTVDNVLRKGRLAHLAP